MTIRLVLSVIGFRSQLSRILKYYIRKPMPLSSRRDNPRYKVQWKIEFCRSRIMRVSKLLNGSDAWKKIVHNL